MSTTTNTPSMEEQLNSAYATLDEKVNAIEQALYIRNQTPDKIILMLGRLINDCDQKPLVNMLQLRTQGTVEICSRIASVYIRLFTDFTQRWNINEVFLLTLQKRFITQVFEISGFTSNQSALKLLLDKAKEKKSNHPTSNPAMLRALMLGSISDIDMANLVELSLDNSETAAIITIGLLLDRLPLSLTGEATRRFLLEEYNPYDALRTDESFKDIIACIWMLCSYSTTEHKHGIKRHLNNWYKRLNKSKGINPKPTGSVKHSGNTSNKPVMAVIAESFNSLHAMYRWYAPIVKQLKQQYYLVLVGMKKDLDEQAIQLFDHYVEVPPEEMNLQPVLNQCTPDIAYFMSVGMRSWGIAMANLRWAPLQVMSFGHPATTHSPCIDLVFTNTRTYAGPGPVVQENMLVLESEVGSLIEKHKNLTLPEPPQLSDELISIAVPCNAMKINFHFISALKEIEQRSEKPIRYTFFPSDVGLAHLSTEQRLKGYFPNALVAPRTHYEHYLTLLNQHHIALSPFPFGNATTTIDCMVLGLPIIALLGQEPHSRTDYDILSAFGLEDYCVATTPENYVSGVVRYINTPGLLDELRTLVQSKNFMATHQQSDSETSPLADEFCRALQWAYEHQEEVVNPRGIAFEARGRWSQTTVEEETTTS